MTLLGGDDAEFEVPPDSLLFADEGLIALEDAWSDNELGLFDDEEEESSSLLGCFDDDDEEEEEVEVDFFAENKEEAPLIDQLKDNFLEQVNNELDTKMTIQDFEQSQLDVHGIARQQDEDPEMVSKALHDLDVEILKWKRDCTKQCENYRLAEEQSNDGRISSRSFRLMFLRSVEFDVQAAVRKVMAYFDLKLDIWGREKLGKKITLADFDEHDMATLRNGQAQLLPVRDHAGRSVLFNNLNHVQYEDPMNLVRTIWYLGMTAVEDEETQKNGLVFIQYKVGEQQGKRPNRRLLWYGCVGAGVMPIRAGCVHLCFGRQSLPFVRLLKYALDYHTSRRVRVHEGSQAECLHTLTTFGIQRFAIPIASNGEITKSYHLDWLEKRQAEVRKVTVVLDETSTTSTTTTTTTETNTPDGVLLPSQKDILLGRGKRSQYHPGNIRLNLLLESKLADFDRRDKKEKKELLFSVINHVKKNGGRFLKKGKGVYWEAVSDDVVRHKIAHDFRTIRHRLSTQRSEDADGRREKRQANLVGD